MPRRTVPPPPRSWTGLSLTWRQLLPHAHFIGSRDWPASPATFLPAGCSRRKLRWSGKALWIALTSLMHIEPLGS
jgi:hypothetical protein